VKRTGIDCNKDIRTPLAHRRKNLTPCCENFRKEGEDASDSDCPKPAGVDKDIHTGGLHRGSAHPPDLNIREPSH
jgi:hypothetical protein